MHTREERKEQFGRLLDIMNELREQCPWDRKQTVETLRLHTIEELYELVDAINEGDMNAVKEELGDLLLHIVFYSKIAEEEGHFDVGDAIVSICEKLIKRHPHIYGDIDVRDDEEVKKNWQQLKLKEGKESILEGVPKALPALVKAYRMQEKTASVGFEWETTEDVWDKVREELDELQIAVHHSRKSREEIEMEFGDVLFSLINYARFIDVDPEGALEKVNQKFMHRFQYIEKQATKPLNEMTLEEMDALWNESKSMEKL